MLLHKRILQLTIVIIAVLIGFILYDDVDQTNIKEEFSQSLKNWFDRGKYYLYKDEYQIFYVLDQIANYKSGSDEPINDDDTATILLLHGFPTSSFDYYKLWNQFKQLENNENFYVNKRINSLLTFDFMGYGFSDKPLNYEYSIFDMADMVDKLLLHLNIRNVYIVAHDISDTVALELLRRDNLKNQNHFHIERVVMLNGGIFHKEINLQLGQEILRKDYIKNLFANSLFKFLLFKQSFPHVFGDFKQPNEVELWDYYLGIKYNQGNKVLPLTISYLSDREQYGEVWLEALNETSLPVSFIYGPADPVNPRTKFPQLLRTELPRVKLTILSELIGHYPQIEDPFTVFELIRQFFI